MIETTRIPAVAGMFYPANAKDLRDMLRGFLQNVSTEEAIPKAIIAPHAGYIYSGTTAANAYAGLLRAKEIIKRVILIGPSHRLPFRGIAASSMQSFATPLGNVPVDKEAVDSILDFPPVFILDQAHIREHSLEVHLPFLQEMLGDFKIVPLLVGEASPKEISQILEKLWGGEETLIVISSDLSHYLDYESARKLDTRTTQAIESLRYEDIHHEQACGRNPINGLLYLARKKGMQVHTVDLRNSGDTAGSKDRVVGYGAYVFN